MEGSQTQRYQVIITASAEMSFYEFSSYLYEHYSIEKAEELSTALKDKVGELINYPHRGSIEPQLTGRKNLYRYILFKRTPRATVKILYYVDEVEKSVYITDFFLPRWMITNCRHGTNKLSNLQKAIRQSVLKHHPLREMEKSAKNISLS